MSRRKENFKMLRLIWKIKHKFQEKREGTKLLALYRDKMKSDRLCQIQQHRSEQCTSQIRNIASNSLFFYCVNQRIARWHINARAYLHILKR